MASIYRLLHIPYCILLEENMEKATIREVRAYVIAPTEMGADYHNQHGMHWINELPIANPMSVYEEYKAKRTSWGRVLGSNGTENRFKHPHATSSSLSAGFLSGRNSPRATDSGTEKA